jgi:hypothetical protein
MYLLYADESGDPGLAPGGTDWFVISGLIIHEADWNDVFQSVVQLRRTLHSAYGVPQRVGLHATDIIGGHGDFQYARCGLAQPARLALYQDVIDFVATLTGKVHVLNLCIRKRAITPPCDVFERGWCYFVQRFHNSIAAGGCLARAQPDYGLLFTDRTHDDHLRRLLRRMRAFNYVPSMFGTGTLRILVTQVLDDPIPRVSGHSYFVQLADMVAFALARRDFPRSNLRRFQFETWFDRLNPVLLTKATYKNPQGVVYWPLP